jgi:hypothetical protein
MLKRSIIVMSVLGLAFGSVPSPSADLQVRKMKQSGFEPRKDSTRIESAAEAAQLPLGTTLLFKCARCGGTQSVAVDEAKSQLLWFHGYKGKKCPGPCGGWVRYESVRSPAGPDHPYNRNTCSRCRKPTISWTVAKSMHG